MIVKQVSIPIAAIGRTAIVAQVVEARDGIVVYHLYDVDGMIAMSRYSLTADAPFTLTSEEVAELNYIPAVMI